jgi:hypothetical protein
MNVRTRDETLSATVVELLDIETLAELEQFKSNLITHGFRELHQVASPDGTVLLCLTYKGVTIHCDLEEMVGARAKLVDLYGNGNLTETLETIKSLK